MHRSLRFAGVTFALLSLAACRQNDEPDDAVDTLARAQDYRTWARAPGYETRQPAESPHSDQVEIFVNPVVEAALADAAGATEWPVGSVVVKDGYADSGDLELVALMERRDDGWFWAEYDASGEPLYSGSPDICVDCHDSGSDFVRAFSLR
jgi:hypothetical protein